MFLFTYHISNDFKAAYNRSIRLNDRFFVCLLFVRMQRTNILKNLSLTLKSCPSNVYSRVYFQRCFKQLHTNQSYEWERENQRLRKRANSQEYKIMLNAYDQIKLTCIVRCLSNRMDLCKLIRPNLNVSTLILFLFFFLFWSQHKNSLN